MSTRIFQKNLNVLLGLTILFVFGGMQISTGSWIGMDAQAAEIEINPCAKATFDDASCKRIRMAVLKKVLRTVPDLNPEGNCALKGPQIVRKWFQGDEVTLAELEKIRAWTLSSTDEGVRVLSMVAAGMFVEKQAKAAVPEFRADRYRLRLEQQYYSTMPDRQIAAIGRVLFPAA